VLKYAACYNSKSCNPKVPGNANAVKERIYAFPEDL